MSDDTSLRTHWDFHSWNGTQTISNEIVNSYYVGTNDVNCPILRYTVTAFSEDARPYSKCMIDEPSFAMTDTDAARVYGVGTTKDTFKIEVKPDLFFLNETHSFMIES
jgi:hypothetical protein